MEVLLRAKEEGLTRNVGFTCHHDESAQLILHNYSEFATMLFPVNYAYREQKDGSKEALAACLQRNMGVLAIKSLAQRKWMEGEEVTHPHCWYRPISDDPDLARLALNYTLSQNGVTTAIPPGDERMLRLALDIIEAQNGSATLLTPSENELLVARAKEVSQVIF
jgi:predicted aldo/keto reductase-like oxidoreductase